MKALSYRKYLQQDTADPVMRMPDIVKQLKACYVL